MGMEGIRLYPYQERAVETMVRSNLMLAFDPGLGKTVSAIAAVEALRDDGQIEGPGIVVAPSSLKFQWAREIHRYTDRKAVVVDGLPARRSKQYQESCDYLILSYDLFVRDWVLHKNVRAFLIADEASALRGWDTKRTKHFKKTRDHYPIRFALTATPIENGKPDEIFSIMEWLDPGVLGKFWDFEKKYLKRNPMGWVEGYRNLNEFHRTIKPYVIRKAHNDPEVAGVLPAVVHKEPMVVKLDLLSERIHAKMVLDLLVDLEQVASVLRASAISKEIENRYKSSKTPLDGKMMAKIQALRMFLNAPELLEEHIGTNDAAASVVVNNPAYFSMASLPSVKLAALARYIDDFLDVHPDNKIVVFTSFVGMAKRIATLMPAKSVLFHGGMSPRARDEAKGIFSSDKDVRVFVSTDAGGYGLDLPEANLVINYDLPWSAGMLEQRNGRIRRASSTWGHVTIQDIVVEGSIEERMIQMLEHKMAVATAILSGEGITESGGVSSDLDTLRSFLSKGG